MECLKQSRKPSPSPTGPATATIPNREKALQILSKSIYKELRQNGYEPKQIVALATEIISQVTSDIKDENRSINEDKVVTRQSRKRESSRLVILTAVPRIFSSF